MRRWNGWGDDSNNSAVQPGIAHVVESLLGPGRPPQDVALRTWWRRFPSTRLAPHPLVTTHPAERVRHARGQSFPDLIAMRSGTGLVFPDGVSFPASAQEVRELLRYAGRTGAQVIPYGGGTSVTGHVNVLPSSAPMLTIDLGRLHQLHSLDDVSNLADYRSPVCPVLGSRRACAPTATPSATFPQSFEFSTLGGWIATRSQRPAVAVLRPHRAALRRRPAGDAVQATLELPALPASSAGPDLREARARLGGPPGHHHRGHRAGLASAGARGVRRHLLPDLEQGGRGRRAARAGATAALDAAPVGRHRDR